MNVRERAKEIVTAMIDALGADIDPEPVTTAVLEVVRERRQKGFYGAALPVLQDLLNFHVDSENGR